MCAKWYCVLSQTSYSFAVPLAVPALTGIVIWFGIFYYFNLDLLKDDFGTCSTDASLWWLCGMTLWPLLLGLKLCAAGQLI